MSRRWWLFLALVGFAAGGAALWWYAAPWVVERGRSLLERRLAQSLHMPVRLGALTVTLVPPAVDVKDVAIAEGGGALRIASARVRLIPGASLHQLRPVAEVDVDRIDVDPTKFAHEPSGEPVEGVLPPFEIRRLQINGARLVVVGGDEPIAVSFEQLAGAVEAPASTGRLSATIRVEQVRLQRQQETLNLDSIRLTAAEAECGWVVAQLEVRGEDVTITVTGQEGATPRHTVEADLAIQRLRILEEHFASVTGRLRLGGTMTGSLAEPDGKMTIGATGLMIEEHAAGDFRGEIEFHGRRIQLTSGRLEGLGGELTFGGGVTLSETFPFELDVDFGDVGLGAAASATGAPEAAAVIARGHIGLRGALDPLALDARADGEFGLAHGREAVPVTWSASGRYQSSGGRVELSALQGTANQVHGDLAVAADGGLSGAVRAELADTGAVRALALGVPLPAVAGSLAMSAQIAGTLAEPSIAGDVRGRRVQWLGVMVDQVGGAFAADRQAVRVEDLSLAIGGGRVRAGGTFALAAAGENAWEASVQGLSTNPLITAIEDVSGSRVPVWSGTLSANMAGRGPWTRASLRGSLSLVNFYLLGEPFEELSIGVDANWPQWNADARVRHLADERLEAILNGTGVEWVQASLRGDDWQLERLRGASSLGLKGRANGSVDVNGPVRQLGGRVAIGLSGLEWRERSVGRVRFAAEGVKGNWHFDGSVEERIQLHGDLVGSGRYPATLRLEWDHADLVPFLTKDTEVRSDSSGTIELRAPLLAARELEGDVQIATLSIAHGEQQLATTEPIRLRGRKGRFTIESLSLAGKDAELAGEGDLSTSGEIDVRVRAGCDLGWLEVLLGPVKSARGRAAVDVAIQRSAMGHWQLAGSGSVEDGGIDLGLPFGMEDVHGRFSLTGSSLRIDELKGDTAGGTFAVDGSIDLESGPALTCVFSGVSPTLLADLESEFSGHGSVRGSWDDLTVAGDIEVSRALYEKRLGLTDVIPWFRRELAPVRSTAPGKGTVRLDLHVAAADEIFIDTTVAKAELRADLHVGGTVGQVTVAGPIEMLSGEVAFRNRKFTIESGVVEFQPALGLNPSLNITAESAIETPSASYTVRVQVVGTAEKYQVLLSSDDPSLSETDLTSLVSFGKTSAQLQQGGGGVSVNDLIALAPGLYRDDIEQQVRRVLPIDRVQFESAYSRSTGSYEPRVTVAKDLTERFTGLVSTTFGVENRHGVQLEYRLSPRVWLSGKWESETTTEAGAFGGDVKFRYAFHRPRFSLLMPWRGWFDGELW